MIESKPIVVIPSLHSGSAPLLSAFLAGRSSNTLRAYRRDVNDFQRFLAAPSPEDALRHLLVRGPFAANALGLAYRAHLLSRGLAPATVNRRLATLRSAVKLARLLGVVSWVLEVPAVRSEAYRDTRGPGRDAIQAALRILGSDDRKSIRDRAIVRLLFDLGLRRGEVTQLDLESVDLFQSTLSVKSKGRLEHILLSLPAPTQNALAAWIDVRGQHNGPLFTNLDRARKGSRLTGTSVWRILRRVGDSLGVTLRPHGIRHSAITEALDQTNGDVRAVQRFSRHKDLRVLNVYDDSREDLGGRVARLVAQSAT